jgi:hypothetical protein
MGSKGRQQQQEEVIRMCRWQMQKHLTRSSTQHQAMLMVLGLAQQQQQEQQLTRYLLLLLLLLLLQR